MKTKVNGELIKKLYTIPEEYSNLQQASLERFKNNELLSEERKPIRIKIYRIPTLEGYKTVTDLNSVYKKLEKERKLDDFEIGLELYSGSGVSEGELADISDEFKKKNGLKYAGKDLILDKGMSEPLLNVLNTAINIGWAYFFPICSPFAAFSVAQTAYSIYRYRNAEKRKIILERLISSELGMGEDEKIKERLERIEKELIDYGGEEAELYKSLELLAKEAELKEVSEFYKEYTEGYMPPQTFYDVLKGLKKKIKEKFAGEEKFLESHKTLKRLMSKVKKLFSEGVKIPNDVGGAISNLLTKFQLDDTNKKIKQQALSSLGERGKVKVSVYVVPTFDSYEVLLKPGFDNDGFYHKIAENGVQPVIEVIGPSKLRLTEKEKQELKWNLVDYLYPQAKAQKVATRYNLKKQLSQRPNLWFGLIFLFWGLRLENPINAYVYIGATSLINSSVGNLLRKKILKKTFEHNTMLEVGIEKLYNYPEVELKTDSRFDGLEEIISKYRNEEDAYKAARLEVEKLGIEGIKDVYDELALASLKRDPRPRQGIIGIPRGE